MLFGVILCFYFQYFISPSTEIGALLYKCVPMFVLVYRSHRDFTIADLFVGPFAGNVPRNTLCL